jgi:hypothetical protein
MDTCLKELDAVWIKYWKRRIKKEEVLALVEFCYQDEEQPDATDSTEAEAAADHEQADPDFQV